MQNTEGSFFKTIKNRLTEALKKQFSKSKAEYMILVLDSTTQAIVFSMFSALELSLLNINITHDLADKKRKRNYDAIYLLTPCRESVHTLCQDFQKYQRYLKAFVLFTNSLSQEFINIIKSNKGLLKYLHGLEEIDLEVRCCQTDVFCLDSSRYFDRRNTKQWLDETVRRLGSAVLSYYPFNEITIVHAERQEQLANGIEKYLRLRIETYQKCKITNNEARTPRLTVLLVDRQEDYQSPLMRSYQYMPLIYDIFRIHRNTLVQDKKEHELIPCTDSMWEQLKYLDLTEASEILEKYTLQLKNYTQSKKDSLEKLDALGKNLKLRDELSIHCELMRVLMEKEGRDTVELSILEQTIVNGIDTKGKKLSDSDIYKQICKFFKSAVNISLVNYARIFVLCLMSLDLSKNQIQSLIVNLKGTSYEILNQIIKHIIPKPKKLAERKQGQDRQNLFRHQPMVVTTFQKFLKKQAQGLQERVLEFQVPKRGKLLQLTLQPKLFVFVQGFLGYNEIYSMMRIPCTEQRIFSSNLVVSPPEYLKQLNDISKK